MDVRRVSCVSSGGLRLGMLRTRAAWKGVAAHAVILKPASHKQEQFSNRAAAAAADLRVGFYWISQGRQGPSSLRSA